MFIHHLFEICYKHKYCYKEVVPIITEFNHKKHTTAGMMNDIVMVITQFWEEWMLNSEQYL